MEKILTHQEAKELLEKGKGNVVIYGDEKEVLRYTERCSSVLAVSATEWGAMNRRCVSLDTLMKDGEDQIRKYMETCSAFLLFEFEKLSAKRFDEVMGLAFSAKKKPRIILVGDLKTRIGCPANDYTSAVQSEHWKGLNLEVYRVLISKVDDAYRKAVDAVRNGDFAGAEWLNVHCAKEPPEKAVKIVTSNSDAETFNRLSAPMIKSNGIMRPLSRWAYRSYTRFLDEEKETFPVPYYLLVFANEQAMTVIHPEVEDYYAFDSEVGNVEPHIGEEDAACFITGLDSRRYATWEQRKLTFKINELGNAVFGHEIIRDFTQYNLIPAHAVSLQQTDLMTLENVIIDPDTTLPGELAAKLSRCRSANGLYLTRPITPEDIKTDAEIIKALG